MKFETLKAIEDPKQRISVLLCRYITTQGLITSVAQAMLVLNVVFKSNMYTMLCYGFCFYFPEFRNAVTWPPLA